MKILRGISGKVKKPVSAGAQRPVAGITALVPPEIIFSSGWSALDINNGVPGSDAHPVSKLCAWTACWRDAILDGKLDLDSLVVVAGGDCHNALADGQNAARNVAHTHFFFYPFDGDAGYLEDQLEKLRAFLHRIRPPGKFQDDPMGQIARLKEIGQKLEWARSNDEADPQTVFKTLMSFSDFEGDIARFQKKLALAVSERFTPAEGMARVALIGVPPIYRDFHGVCAGAGLHVVFDELPFEFVRLGGMDLAELAKSYSGYSFARPVGYRMKRLKAELKKRDVAAVIHYTQFTCHHLLEDRLLRDELDWPILTVQGDLPGQTPAQIRLRLEAFGEMLGARQRNSGGGK